MKHYIGVYLYLSEKTIALGLTSFEIFCESEEVCTQIESLLRDYDLSPIHITNVVMAC